MRKFDKDFKKQFNELVVQGKDDKDNSYKGFEEMVMTVNTRLNK